MLKAIDAYAGSKCRRDPSRALADVHPGFTLDIPTLCIAIKGREAVHGQLASFFETFPDYDAEITDVIVGDDRVVYHCCESGTMRGDLLGLKATGQRAIFPTTSLYTFRDGLLAGERWHFSLMSFAAQLGLSMDALAAQRESHFGPMGPLPTTADDSQ